MKCNKKIKIMLEVNKDLVKKFQAEKNTKDFEVIFNYFAPKIKSLLMRSGADGAQAEDIMHDTMINIWEKIHMYNPDKGSFSSWVYTIARNNRIDLLRKKSSQPYTDISEVEIASDNESGLDIVEQKSISAHVKKAIELLPLKQRKVIELSFVNDLTQEEIAGELNIPIGTVKSRMRLAYQKMKDNLKELQA
jgi:RNA polymerase sigma-70 factor (ECF subfamily)